MTITTGIADHQPTSMSGTESGWPRRPRFFPHAGDHTPRRRGFLPAAGMRFLPLFAGAALVIPATSACQPPTPPPPSTTAGVNAEAQSPTAPGATCTGDLTWRYTLVSAVSGTGTTGSFSHARTYSFPSSGSQCLYQDGALGLHPGKWQISVLNLSCTVSLPATTGNSVLNMNNCQVI